jgi:hypothetical protein
VWEDPIVEETRKVRREIELECDDDFDRLLAKAVEIQKKYSTRLVPKLSELKEETELAPAGRA